MNSIYCLEIEFPSIDFSSYNLKGEVEVSIIHYAELCTKPDKIELKIFYDERTYFGDKLGNWLQSIDFKKFGFYIKVEIAQNDDNERLQKIDLSKAKLCGFSNSTDYYNNDDKYVVINIDTVKFYWDSNPERNNTAEFYLDERGFRVVEPFYTAFHPTTFFKNDGKFQSIRMKDSEDFYELGKSLFRPEFNFLVKDNKQDREATIIKEPKIQFHFQDEISEELALFYGDVVLMLASFYHHIKIDFTIRRIHLPSNTITIKKIENKNYINRSGNLRGFGINYNFNNFLKKSWQSETLKNYNLLSKAVGLFNQSLIVDNASAFLIRYNIIEICDKQKQKNDKFTFILNCKQTKIKQNEALVKLLETIQIDEQEEFKKRWQNVQTLLQNKPMKNQLISFLENQSLDPKNFPVKIKDLKELRDNITHGSIDKIDVELLNKANVLLYRISGILILNLMGNKDWILNTEIK